jgi:hypothetical protein
MSFFIVGLLYAAIAAHPLGTRIARKGSKKKVKRRKGEKEKRGGWVVSSSPLPLFPSACSERAFVTFNVQTF